MKVIGVDFGSTNIRVALADDQGNILLQTRRLTGGKQGQAAVIDNLVGAIEEVLTSSQTGWSEIACVGVGAGGPLDPKTGVIFKIASLPDWENVPLLSILTERLGLAVRLANDANLAALGEYCFGAGRGYRYLVYLTLSTGVGAGIIEDGRIIEGAKGGAGEVGHFTIDINGPACPCGNIGCLALYVSGSAIAWWARRELEAGQESKLRALCQDDLRQVNAAMVAEAARQNDPYAVELLRRTSEYLGAGITSILHLYNPQVVIIGGGAAQIGAPLLDPARQWVTAHAMPGYEAPVILAELGDDAGLYGAIALALEEKGENYD